MNATHDQIEIADKANAEALLSIGNAAFAGAERLAALNLSTARALLEDSIANAKAMLAVKDVKDLISIQTALAQPTVEKAVAYSRSLYEITSETQEELSKAMGTQASDLGRNVVSALDKAVKYAPQSDSAVSAVKSAIVAANSAYDSMTKAARQVAEIAEANVAAATSATVKAIGSAAAKAKKAS